MSGINKFFFDAGELAESDIDKITKNCSCNIKDDNYSLVLSFVSSRTIIQFKITGLSLTVRLRRDYSYTNWSKWSILSGFTE